MHIAIPLLLVFMSVIFLAGHYQRAVKKKQQEDALMRQRRDVTPPLLKNATAS